MTNYLIKILILGRRRISLTWSPEKATITSVRTPTKSAFGTTTMTLRSSPRKRLLMNDIAQITPEKLSSPRKLNGSPSTTPGASTKNWYPSSKRLRFEDKPIGQTNHNTPLNKILKGLSSDQLLGIIQGLVAQQPELEKQIRADIPTPNLKPFEEQLNSAKKMIFKSLPASRLCNKTDSVSYSRASTHLVTFKKMVTDQSRIYSESEHWDALLDYSMLAWSYVKSLPLWENHAHNSTRRYCFKILSMHCANALKYGGVLLGEQRLNEFSARINQMAIDCDDISACSPKLNNIMISLHSGGGGGVGGSIYGTSLSSTSLSISLPI